MYQVAAYIMDKRVDSMNMITIDIPLDPVQNYLNEKRKQGISLSHMDVLVAAYPRTVAEYPLLNRFIVNKKAYARNELAIAMVVLKAGQADNGTMSKMYFDASNTIFEVHDIIEKYVTEISENAIKRELIFNYLCQTHELGADEQTIAEEVEKLFQEEADYANAQNPNAGYTAESVRKELEAQYGEGYFEKYVASNLNSERVDDFLFDNYTVIFAEESTEAK